MGAEECGMSFPLRRGSDRDTDNILDLKYLYQEAVIRASNGQGLVAGQLGAVGRLRRVRIRVGLRRAG